VIKKGVTGLLLVFFAVPAFASIPDFTEIDTDKDGAVSRREATAAGMSEQLFARLDRDSDQKLSADEYNVLTKGQS